MYSDIVTIIKPIQDQACQVWDKLRDTGPGFIWLFADAWEWEEVACINDFLCKIANGAATTSAPVAHRAKFPAVNLSAVTLS